MKNRILIGLLALFAGLSAFASEPPFVKPNGWAPYFKDENGREVNFVAPMEKIESKTWVGLQWTDFQGAKLRIAVMPVENKAAQAIPANLPAALAAAYGAQFAQIPVNGIEDLLSVSLQNTNRFRLFERKALESVMAEKNLQATANAAQAQVAQAGGAPVVTQADGLAQMAKMAADQRAVEAQAALQNAARAQQAAKLMGAQYTVYASIVEWTPDKNKKSIGGGGIGSGGGGGLGTLLALAGGLSKSEAEVAMSFRIVDTATGEVKWNLDERATASNWGFSLAGGGIGSGGGGMVGGGMTEKTPINYAVKACINKAVYRIAETLKDIPWRGTVIKANADGKVYINAGKDAGLQPGMVLTALSVGEELKDPITGEVLDSETKPAGRITITDVRDRIAIGNESGTPEGVTLKAGDRVEILGGAGQSGAAQ